MGVGGTRSAADGSSFPRSLSASDSHPRCALSSTKKGISIIRPGHHVIRTGGNDRLTCCSYPLSWVPAYSPFQISSNCFTQETSIRYKDSTLMQTIYPAPTQYLSWFILRNIVAGTHLMMPMNLENDVNKQDHFDNMCVCIHKTTRRVVVMVCILLYLIILISQIKRKPHNTKICIYIDRNYWNFISMSWTWSTEIPCLFSLTHCHRNRVIFSALASTCGLLSCKYLSLKRYS